MKKKEIHLWLSSMITTFYTDEFVNCYTSYIETEQAIYSPNIDIIHTTQLSFLSFRYAERLFVHVGKEVHEITLGECEGTDREIREEHSLDKMLINGVFDWFNRKDEQNG